VLCFGAGGATTAIVLHFVRKRDRADRPRRVTAVNRSEGRLDHRETRQVRVEDGWQYFLHGWTQVIAEVLKVRIDEVMFQPLAAVAGAVCQPALAASLGGV